MIVELVFMERYETFINGRRWLKVPGPDGTFRYLVGRKRK